MSSERPAQTSSQRRLMLAVLYILPYLICGLILLVGVALLCARSLEPGLGGPGAGAVGGIIVVGVVGLYIWLLRRTRVREQVIIALPVEEVFRRIATEFFVTRAQAAARAAPPGTLVAIEQTSAGPLGVGTTGREVIEANGQRGEWFYVVTAYDPPHRFARTATPAQATVQIRVHYDLAPVPGGTRLTLTSDLILRGLWQIFAPFYARTYRGYLQGGAGRLKALLEA